MSIVTVNRIVSKVQLHFVMVKSYCLKIAIAFCDGKIVLFQKRSCIM